MLINELLTSYLVHEQTDHFAYVQSEKVVWVCQWNDSFSHTRNISQLHWCLNLSSGSSDWEDTCVSFMSGSVQPSNDVNHFYYYVWKKWNQPHPVSCASVLLLLSPKVVFHDKCCKTEASGKRASEQSNSVKQKVRTREQKVSFLEEKITAWTSLPLLSPHQKRVH